VDSQFNLRGKQITSNQNISQIINPHKPFDIRGGESVTKEKKESAAAKKKKKSDFGILITHGTDTMAWAFSIMRYMLKNLKCNVVLTGSQRPLKIGFSSTDAGENIKNSLVFLTRAEPPSVAVVFNFGRTVYGSRLNKKHKWEPDAFIGEEIARISWDELKAMGSDMRYKRFVKPLDRLYLIRTGGTIESVRFEEGGLVAGADLVEGFLKQDNQKKYFHELFKSSVVEKDSSDMAFDDWVKVAQRIKEISRDNGCDTYFDEKFEQGVKVIQINPFFTKKDYLKFMDCCEKGLVVAGYGAGNVNSREREDNSVLPMIKKALDDNLYVVLSSQVLEGVSDFEYDTGLKAIDLGAIPSGDLNPIESQVKLSYILGHSKDVGAAAKKYGVNPYYLTESAFLSGVCFRKEQSRRKYLRIRNDQVVNLDEDPFVNRNFKDAINIVARNLKRSTKEKLSTTEYFEEIKYLFDTMGKDFEKISDFVLQTQVFIRQNREWEKINDVRILLARAFLRQFSKEDAEQILKHIPASSECYEKAKELLVNIQRDSDGDGWCDAIEMEWGSDPHDPESIPKKWAK
jgi:L-asparaginase/Glu-tRNA(Gln) amidotransferase subunit D